MGKCGKIILWSITGVILFLFLLYLIGSFFFTSHFFFQTELNGKDISLKTAEEVEMLIKKETEDYELTVVNKDGTKERISGKAIQLKYQENGEIQRLLKKQNPFAWGIAVFQPTNLTVTAEAEYDRNALTSEIRQLKCYTEEEIPPQNAKPEFDGTKYVVKEEVSGSGVDREKLDKVIAGAVDALVREVDLQKEKCYLMPEYTKDSPEVQMACDSLNQYIKANITYSMDVPVVVDGQVISQWLSVNDKMEVQLNEEAVKNWLTEFGDKYDTMGTARTFTTPNGKTATVTGGTYGWSIDEDSEFEYLLNAVKNGETTTKEPAYYIGGTAAVHGMPDWGNTYVDVDLSQQHMWYVVNGNVALETDVVTGEPIPAKITPEGTYTILEKLQDTVLVGETNPATGEPEYRSFVSYWMRVTWSGIGFHDATWQSAFGGTLYQIPNIGSHGCINMPFDKAAELYGMIENGTPVVIHY